MRPLNITSQLEEFDNSKPLAQPSIRNFKKCYQRAGDVADLMRHDFEHGAANGHTTHFPALDKHFKWKPGFLYCITGWAQGGKTEFTQFLAILKSFFEGKKWAIHSPENYPSHRFFNTLAHTLVGMSTNPKHYNKMKREDHEKAIEFLHEHFFYVYEEGIAHTPEYLREAYAYLHSEFGLYGTITDPWNKVAHLKAGLRDDEYLQLQLPQEQQQGRELQLIKMILAHPKSPGRLQKGEALPIPDQYWLAGGQMWDNMCDVIGCVYRPNYHINKADTAVEWHTHKMKMQDVMGIPGVVPFNFDRHKARYFDLDGNCPLVPHIAAPQQQAHDYARGHNLPASDFEAETIRMQNEAPIF